MRKPVKPCPPTVERRPKVIGPARGKRQTTPYEMRERAAMALDLLLLGMTEAQVIRTLVLPPVRPGEKDERNQPKIGGLGITRSQARTALDRAYQRAETRWSMNRGYDRITQKMILEAAIAGAMRDRKWSAVAALTSELAKITGTHEPIEIEVTTGDARKRAMMALIAQMPDDDFAELVPEGEGAPPLMPPH